MVSETRRNPLLREIALASAVYAALLCLAYGNVIFQGKSLVYSDNANPFDARFTVENYGEEFVPEKVWAERNLLLTANFHDAGSGLWQWEPTGPFLRAALADGEMPFWDPYIGGGVPSMANQTAAYFFPPSLLVVLLGNTALLKNLYFLGIAFTAGLFTYLVLRKHELSAAGSFAGGAAFMFCGAISQNIGSFIGQTIACIPLALFVTIWFLEDPTWRRVCGLSVLYAGISLASAPPFLAQALAIAGIYAIARILWWPAANRARARGRAAFRWACACVLGMGLVAWYYVPAFTLLRSTPQATAAYAGAAKDSIPLRCLYELLSPALMDGWKIFLVHAVGRPHGYQIPYLGAAAVLLALLASPRDGPRRALGVFACVGSIVVMLKLFGVAPVQWIAEVPGLRTFHYAAYFGITLDFLIAILAGLGIDSLVRNEVGPLKGWLGALALPVAVLALKENVAGPLGTDPLALHQWEHKWRVLLLGALLASFLAAVAVVARRKAWLRFSAASILALLVAGEGVRNAKYPRQNRRDVWRHPPPYVARLARDAGMTRCLTIATLPADTNSAFGIFSLDSLMTFNPPRIFELYRRYAGGRDATFLRSASTIPPEPVLDSASIGYVVVREGVPGLIEQCEARRYEKIFDDGLNAIFRRVSLPRYFFSSDFRVDRPAAALRDLATPGAPLRQVIVESPPSFPRLPNSSADPAVGIRDFHRNGYALTLDSPRPGLVACSENDFPGWFATVNGRPARILPVNYAFRGVEVPSGKADVRFFYRPPGLRLGTALSGLAASIWMLLAIFERRRRALQRTATGSISLDAPFSSNHATSSSTRSNWSR